MLVSVLFIKIVSLLIEMLPQNITLPCLMFSKIVPAFTPQNISVLGPLVTVALIYESLGLLTAWLVKRFCWVPHRFRYGIICAGAFGNYSDVRKQVAMASSLSSDSGM